MHLVLIIDDYLPHSTRVGAKMFHELALELLSRGHKITVITPDTHQESLFQETDIDGVRVWSFRSGPTKNISKVIRAFNESMLSVRAWRAVGQRISPEMFQGIVYYSPSIFWGGLVARIKKRCRCPAYLVLRDLFPQWVVDAGMMRQGSIIERYFRYFERNSYRQAEHIGLMSERNLDVFRYQHNGYRCEVLRNWASLIATEPESQRISCREKLGLEGKVIFFYGGNIGYAQDMANLMRLARNMHAYENVHFLFVGQGDEVSLIKQLAASWRLKNFTYLPSISQAEFKQILTEVDVGLFSLAANHTAHNFPGKLLGYMVQHLPILGSINANNDLMDIVNKNNAGFIHVNGDDEHLLNSAISLLDKTRRRVMGECAYRLLEAEFSVGTAARLIEDRLESMACD
ncbi:glycosyltransferase WbuB [Yersinia ruckeri]|uniref:glycosyltransferase family 4 protein n=1 Tax=Yersinia ruckeri TaxID=29486 RepID=UPI0004E3539A|nr:glycosyltransferase family 4 protein [Yersinia ruckeri]ARZ02552.1 putative glycosyl transferase [Yersinia ruckeri]EKN4197507.1 glycosyltransferase family 4 protein [Yersinia ruckeri]EKN4204680.1 glycosyltransferase family 4 protein [Yersinia ruckeri]EKN4699109.1 glycosyltransferase family 4 protein [Yersinia ruckeri]EKN4702028.1 glycosyltransferase family 4 protein [Yersinia ruckeri]